MHKFLKQTIVKFMHGSQLKWDDTLPLATYHYNNAPYVDDLKIHFYLVHGRDHLKEDSATSKTVAGMLVTSLAN